MSGRWIRSMGLICFLPVVFGLVVAVAGAIPAAAQENDSVKIKWGMAALVADGDNWRLQPLGVAASLKSGDQLKMMVELQTPCFVYLFHHTSPDQIRLLFPYTTAQLESHAELNRRYFIPAGEEWFELDERVGQEVFSLLVSKRRLPELEELYNRYLGAEGSRKAEVGEQLLAEIRELRRRHRQLTTAAERPVAIGGAIRGLDKAPGGGKPDISSLAVEWSASEFISRTFTIDHRQ